MEKQEASDVRDIIAYAKKQEAIKFKIWCDENEDTINFREEQTHTTEHLYDIFKKENP